MNTRTIPAALALLALAFNANSRPMPDNWEAKDYLGRPVSEIVQMLGIPKDDELMAHPDGVWFIIKDGVVQGVAEKLPDNTDAEKAFAIAEKRAGEKLGQPTQDEAPKRVVWGHRHAAPHAVAIYGEEAAHYTLRPTYRSAMYFTREARQPEPDKSAPWYK